MSTRSRFPSKEMDGQPASQPDKTGENYCYTTLEI